MKTVELIAPCHFGLEAVLKREILDLGYEIVKVEDGRITFRTDLDGIARANILMICLKEQRNFHGKIIFQRMDVSG